MQRTMRWLALPLLAALATPAALHAQTAPATYWVQFTGKGHTPYSLAQPEAYLGPRALEDDGVGELGLTSIGAVELAAALGARIGRDLPQTFAFDHPTVAAMAAHLQGQGEPQAEAPPRAAAPAGGGDLEELLSVIEGGKRGLD